MPRPAQDDGFREITIHAVDGTPLTARLFEPEAAPVRTLIIGGATGVPQGFYRRFALHAANRAHRVITFDYRGIGASRRGPLRGLEASFTLWAEQDLAAVIDYAAHLGAPVSLIGHSFGGHAFALLPDAQKFDKLVALGAGAGWSGWMPMRERVKLEVMWRVLLPVTVPFLGYMPSKRLGIGEDLPLGVYREWRRWTRFPNYFLGDPRAAALAERMARISRPVTTMTARDDLWAPPASRDAFAEGFKSAQVERVTLDPAPYGGLGHMGYFRPNASGLWDQILAAAAP